MTHPATHEQTAAPEQVAAPAQGDSLMRIADVRQVTALGASTIYRKIDEGTFPRPRKIGDKCVRWLRSEIDAWMRSLQA